MDIAVSNGYLELVQWLHENRSEGCTTNATRLAAHFGHFDVVLFLHADRCDGVVANGFNSGAACIKNMEIAQWLHEHYPGSLDIDSLREHGHSYMPAVLKRIVPDAIDI